MEYVFRDTTKSDDHALATYRFSVNAVRLEINPTKIEWQLHLVKVVILGDEIGYYACRERRMHETVTTEPGRVD